MRLDLGTTSLVAALCSTPFAAKLVLTKERNNRSLNGALNSRSITTHFFKWIRKHSTAVTQEGPILTEANHLPVLNPNTIKGLQNFLIGFLVPGITACLLNLAGTASDLKTGYASLSNEMCQLAINQYVSMEESLKQKLKHFEVHVDQTIETAQGESPDLTEEEANNKQQMILEVWETVDLHYYNTRDPNFSKEKWAKLRDEALLRGSKNKANTYRVIRNMLDKGLNDPYAKITPSKDFAKMEKYDMTGVGLNVGSGTDFEQRTSGVVPGKRKNQGGEGIWVLGLIKGSVSDMAGVKIGDQIIEVDGIAVNGSTPFQTAHMIKGKSSHPQVILKKTTYGYQIRKKEGDLEEVTLDRSTTKIAPAVKTSVERVSGGRRVGRIQVVSCTAQARDEVLEALRELQLKNIKEVILDLRENRGGLVQEGVEIAKLFLDEGATVMISRQSPNHHDTRFVSDEGAASSARLIVQVGPETASAAEIIAGALKDNCRGVVVGDRTYGKGLIQSVYALSDGSGLTLTVGQYLTPNMINIDQRGIEPDFRRVPKWKQADEVLQSCRIDRKQPALKVRR